MGQPSRVEPSAAIGDAPHFGPRNPLWMSRVLRRGRRSVDAVLDRVAHELVTATEMELVENVSDVVLDCPR